MSIIITQKGAKEFYDYFWSNKVKDKKEKLTNGICDVINPNFDFLLRKKPSGLQMIYWNRTDSDIPYKNIIFIEGREAKTDDVILESGGVAILHSNPQSLEVYPIRKSMIVSDFETPFQSDIGSKSLYDWKNNFDEFMEINMKERDSGIWLRGFEAILRAGFHTLDEELGKGIYLEVTQRVKYPVLLAFELLEEVEIEVNDNKSYVTASQGDYLVFNNDGSAYPIHKDSGTLEGYYAK